jgi:hypothetical protein
MISKILPSYNNTQQWTSSTTPKAEQNTGTVAWGVATEKTPVAPARTETPTKTAPPSKNILNPLGYGNTPSGNNFDSFSTPSIFKLPTDLSQNPTWQTIQANTFIPVPPSIDGVVLPTATTVANPYGGANGSLGTNLLTSMFNRLT